jgi:rare lipoprotein A
MPSLVEVALLIVASALPLQDVPPAGEGPRATSSEGRRIDAIGYAGTFDAPHGVAHATLPVGSFVEVTALDSGKTALFEVAGSSAAASDEPVALSGDAMRQLAIAAPGAPVRVRAANPTPPDIAALRAGQPAGARLDAPSVLLIGLRKALPLRGGTVATAVPEAPASAPPPRAAATGAARGAPIPVPPARSAARPAAAPAQPIAPASVPRAGWGVQVAALSDAGRARALAKQLGGQARAAGKLWRIQLGPFADRSAAERARADVARRGHPGAALVRVP